MRLAIALALVATTGAAHAGPASVELDREDAPAGRVELGFDGGAPIELGGWGASLGIGYMARPLIVRKEIDEHGYVFAPVQRRMTMVLGGALAIGERLVLDARMPLSRQIGRGLSDFDMGELDRVVLGDLRVALRIRVAGSAASGLFVRAGGSFPTGDDHAFAGEQSSVTTLHMIGRFTAENGVVLAGTVGVRLRSEESSIGGTTSGNELTSAAGAVLPMPYAMHASVEVVGVLGDTVADVRGPSPMEARVGIGAIAYRGMTLGLRLGAGLNDEMGSPLWRAMFEVAWSGEWNLAKHLPTIGEPDDGTD